MYKFIAAGYVVRAYYNDIASEGIINIKNCIVSFEILFNTTATTTVHVQ